MVRFKRDEGVGARSADFSSLRGDSGTTGLGLGAGDLGIRLEVGILDVCGGEVNGVVET